VKIKRNHENTSSPLQYSCSPGVHKNHTQVFTNVYVYMCIRYHNREANWLSGRKYGKILRKWNTPLTLSTKSASEREARYI